MAWASGETINTKLRLQRLSGAIPSSYTIFKKDSFYYAECNIPGGTEYSEADASAVIQAAIDALTSGGLIFLRAAIYTLNTKLTLANNITLMGEGWGSTKLYNAQTDGNPALYLEGTEGSRKDNMRVSNLEIYGTAGGGPGIYFKWANKTALDALYIHDCGTHGVEFIAVMENSTIRCCQLRANTNHGLVLDSCHDVEVMQNNFEENLNNGILLDTLLAGKFSYECVIVGNTIEDNSNHGIEILKTTGTYSSNHIISANQIESNLNFGIRAKAGTHYIINNNQIWLNRQMGIYVEASHCVVNGNNINGNCQAGVGSYDGLRVAGDYSTVNGNRVRDSDNRTEYGINLMGDYCVVMNNNIGGGSIAPMTVSGASCLVRNNRGYVTENSGTSTGTGAEQTIPHGLAGDLIPNNVTVVPTVTGATVSGVWADATNIYCTVTVDKAFRWTASVI